MRWVLPCLLVGRAAFAEPPSLTPPSPSPPSPTPQTQPASDVKYGVSLRVGVAKTRYLEDSSHAQAAPTGELGLVVWVSPRASITAFIEHTRWTFESEYYGTYTDVPINFTELGAQLAFHPWPTTAFGMSFGGAAYRERDPDAPWRSMKYGQFLGAFFDVNVARYGWGTVVLGGHAELGPAASAAFTGGIIWSEGPPATAVPDDADPVVTLRLGDGHFNSFSEDTHAEGSIPSVEVAAGTPIGELHGSVTRFSDRVNDASIDEYYDASYTLVTAGLRHRWHVLPRVVIAAGAGGMFVNERDHSRGKTETGGAFVSDVIASFRIVRFGATSIELFDRIQVIIGAPNPLGASSLFGLGVAYTP